VNTFVVWLVIFLVIIIVSTIARRNERKESINKEKYPQVSLPFSERIKRRLLMWNRSRKMSTHEFMLDPSAAVSTIRVLFFVPRTPLEINISFANIQPARINSVKTGESGKAVSLPFGVKYSTSSKGGSARIAIIPDNIVDRLEIETDITSQDVQYYVSIIARSEMQPDLKLLASAFDDLSKGRFESAKKSFHRYEDYCSQNPNVSMSLARIYMNSKDYSKAEEYALRAAAIGQLSDGIDMYRSIQNEKDVFVPLDEVRSLKERAGGWPEETHYGVVELQKNQRFLLGLGDFHAKFCSEVMIIRRQSAARMLRRLNFDFDARKEIVLDSKLRILNKDFEVETVPEENIFINDSAERNIYITGEEERECGWILPDLAVGDVVEWHYSVISRSASEKSGMFILAGLNHPYFPTFESRIAFEALPDFEFSICSREGPVEELKKSTGDDGKIRYEVNDSKYLPSKNTGYFYENNLLNPVYACAAVETSWKPVADNLKNEVLGEHFEKEQLPGLLQIIADNATSAEQALEQSFYWIRDKLKYASLPSGFKQIGKMGRAMEIIEAGTGNCNDKSYLLCLLCRELKVPFEMVAVSVKDGVVFKDLPAKQFDHVFVRAMVDGRWLYMDASDTYSVFGSAPPYSQGLDAMIVNGEARLEVIPEDSVDSNRIEVSETIENINGGWVETELDIRSAGSPARNLDEILKSVSLSFHDQNQAMQEGLRSILPGLIVTEFEKTSNTADSNYCNLTCSGKRCLLIPLGNRSAANFRWFVPTLPAAYWRAFVNDTLYVFSYPQSIRFTLTLRGEVLNKLSDISGIAGYSGDICRVSESCEKGSDFYTITRQIDLKKKYVHSDQMKHFPEVMQSIEQALQLVAILSR
jgi:hypothetical protein